MLIGLVGCIGGAVAVGGSFKDDFTVPGIESQKAQDLLEQRFPAQSGTQATLVFSGSDLDAGAIGSALKHDRAPAARRRRSTSCGISEDGRTAYATVSYDQTATDLDATARERLEDATAGLPKSGIAVAMSGEPIDGAATGGFPIGEVVGLGIAVLLLIVVLRNLRAARQRALRRARGRRARLRRAAVGGPATDVPGLAPTLAGMLGLGAGIDYALLLSARQQEELRRGRTPVEAAKRANATAGHSALTAAGIVLVSISGLLVTGIPFVGRAGVAAGLVVLACAVMCVVLLPARFGRRGTRMLPAVSATSDRARRARPSRPRGRPSARSSPCWPPAWSPLALAAPAANLELGQPDDRNLTTDTTQRQAYDQLAEGFGAGVNGPLVVAVSCPTASPTPRWSR